MIEPTNQSLTNILFGLAKDPIINTITNVLDIYQINKLKFVCGIFDGYDIMDSGCQVGSLEMIKYAHVNIDDNLCSINIPVKYGYLDCVKYLHENGYRWNKYSCKAASKNGHLEVIKYLHENRCYWNEYRCNEASTNGHLVVLN